MTEISDAARYAAAWKDRRLRFFVYVTELYSLVIFIAVPLLCQAVPRLYRYVPDGYIWVFPAWFVGNMVVGVWLNRFRCPRCGNFFYWNWTWKVERAKNWRACRHCGLLQDSEPA